MSDSIEITGVWLCIDAEEVGREVTVLVRLTDGTWREAISEIYPGPASHTSYPAKIRKAEAVSNDA